ncbi:MAG: flagellar biosynthesis protein FlgA [Oscillochloris sp.]|nr:flagellar biosynthesis protein FlgA [Oscillochloris sp.]
MATLPTSSSTPLSQAFARKKSNPLPAIILAVGLLSAIGFAVLGYLESRRTEAVVILAHDIPYGAQISADDLGVIELPLHRPTQLQGIADPQTIVGQYAARNLGTNDVVQPAMLMPQPPTQPVYPNGEALAPNMVPVPFSTATIGPINFRDRVNIGFNDPTGDPTLCDAALSAAGGNEPTMIAAQNSPLQPRPYACRLLSSVRVLYVDDGAGIAYLELSPYQSHTIWALQSAGLQLWGERYGVGSDDLGALHRLDIGQVNYEQLTAPVTTPEFPSDTPSLPGAGNPIPGSVQP